MGAARPGLTYGKLIRSEWALANCPCSVSRTAATLGRLRETLPGPSPWWFRGRLPLRPPHGGGPGITEKRWLTVSGLARLPCPGSSCLCSTAALCTVRGLRHPAVVSSVSVSYRRRALVSHPLLDRLPDRNALDSSRRGGVALSARLVAAPAVAIGGGSGWVDWFRHW